MKSDTWHNRLYDPLFIQETIGSKEWRRRAQREVAFLTETLCLPKGARVLDIPCGTGRHAILLTRKGYNVTGIDINSDCLKIAKQSNAHKNVRYVRGNLSNLYQYRNRFDAVVNLFTSFGYFATDKKNEGVMRQLVTALKPGGQLVISTIDRDYILKHLDPARWLLAGKYTVIESSRYDPRKKYIETWRVFATRKSHNASAYYSRLRLYSRSEMVALMRKCVLRKIRVYGDTAGNNFNRFTSSHPFYIGVK